jgi:hypothetical protein
MLLMDLSATDGTLLRLLEGLAVISNQCFVGTRPKDSASSLGPARVSAGLVRASFAISRAALVQLAQDSASPSYLQGAHAAVDSGEQRDHFLRDHYDLKRPLERCRFAAARWPHQRHLEAHRTALRSDGVGGGRP